MQRNIHLSGLFFSIFLLVFSFVGTSRVSLEIHAGTTTDVAQTQPSTECSIFPATHHQFPRSSSLPVEFEIELEPEEEDGSRKDLQHWALAGFDPASKVSVRPPPYTTPLSTYHTPIFLLLEEFRI